MVNSGEHLPLEIGNLYNENTNNERFSYWYSSGYTYKHNNWNNEHNSILLSNEFVGKASLREQKTYFKSLNFSKKETKLEDHLISENGSVKFQDPWYVKSDGSQAGNYWITATGFYEPTGKEDV